MSWLPWVHDLSQSALAAAVLLLGLVLLLELRCVVQLRRTVDRDLARVFEQLDLLRFENQQLLEVTGERQVVPTGGAVDGATATTALAAAVPPSAPAAPLAASAAGPAAGPFAGGEPASLPSGEAKLLASLAEARARRRG